MTIARIRSAFETKVKDWAQAQSPVIPVAYENTKFTPPDGRYARAFVLPGETTSNDLGGKHRRYVGVFQVSLHLPNEGGTATASTLAASLDAAFPLTAPLSASGLKVFLTTPMSQGPALSEGGHYRVPVSCRYRAEDDTA